MPTNPTQLDRARKIIREAEETLGPLGLQRCDLLLDNMSDLPGVAEAKALISEIDATACTCDLQKGTEAEGYHHPECPEFEAGGQEFNYAPKSKLAADRELGATDPEEVV